MATETKDAVRTDAIQRKLECKLTDTEKRRAGEALGAAVQSYNDIEQEKKSVMADFKHRLEVGLGEVQRLKEIVNTGKERREVECTRTVNRQTNRVVVVREDTGETIEDRKLNADESQIEMNLM